MVEGGVFTFSENMEVGLELLSKGRELANALRTKLSGILLGHGVKDRAKELIAHGADSVYVGDDPSLADFFVETYTDALVGLVEQHRPEIVLIGSTKRGRELAPRVATRLKVGCVSDCTNLIIDDKGELIAERPAVAAMVIAEEVFRTKPKIATVPPKTFEKLQRDETRVGEVVEIKVEVGEVEKRIVERRAKEVRGIKIEDAELITSGGRGFKKKEDFKLLEELASAIGATVGCSRPIAADLKWLPEDHWVGLSGHKVKPKLYLATGISGQVQHLAGMRNSKTIVAINKDKDAPIFKAADYGIVGDLYQILPALTNYIKSKRASSS